MDSSSNSNPQATPMPSPTTSTPKPTPKPKRNAGHLVKSPVVLSEPRPGDPPFDMDRLIVYRDDPSPDSERCARELLARCGPLVLDGVQYRIEGERIQAVPVEFLGIDRQRLASGIDKMNVSEV